MMIGDDPEILQVKCVTLILLEIRLAHHPRAPDERIRLARGTANKHPLIIALQAVADYPAHVLMRISTE